MHIFQMTFLRVQRCPGTGLLPVHGAAMRHATWPQLSWVNDGWVLHLGSVGYLLGWESNPQPFDLGSDALPTRASPSCYIVLEKGRVTERPPQPQKDTAQKARAD